MHETKPKRAEGVEIRIEDMESSFALAIAVLRERISRLSDDDKNDLFELLPELLNTNCEEERQAAIHAVTEILNKTGGKVTKAPKIEPGVELNGWIGFISERIKSLREEAGLTQTQLAEKAGLPQPHISRLEAGKHSPTAKTLQKIAQALGVKVSQLDPSSE